MWSGRWKSLLGAVALVAAGCNLSDDGGKAYMEIHVDSSWFAYDSLYIILADPSSGKHLDTVFRGPVKSADDVKRIPVPGYEGGSVKVVIVGFKEGRPARQEDRNFNGSETVDKKPVDPYQGKRLSLAPDRILLYMGGESRVLTPEPASDWNDIRLTWTSRDTAKATVNDSGKVSPKGLGLTRVVVRVNDSLKDSVEVEVRRDIPVVEAGGDTAVLVNTDVSFAVRAVQEYGHIKAFSWDLNGDGRYDDTAGPFPDSQTVFRTSETRFGDTGTVTVRFRLEDGEGNEAMATRKVKVSGRVPRIDSLTRDTTVTVGDSLALSARASMQGGGALARYAWDYDGDSAADDQGTLSGSQARITGGVRYSRAGDFTVILTVTDSAGTQVSRSFQVQVKASPKNAHLASLILSTGALTPRFHKDSLSYRSLASEGQGDAAVFATAESGTATVSINGAPAGAGGASANIVLLPGTNRITVRVISEDRSVTRDYAVAVTVPPNGEIVE